MSNVVDLFEDNSITADEVLDDMKGKLEGVLVVGWGKNGELRLNGTRMREFSALLYDLKIVELVLNEKILDMMDNYEN